MHMGTGSGAVPMCGADDDLGRGDGLGQGRGDDLDEMFGAVGRYDGNVSLNLLKMH